MPEEGFKPKDGGCLAWVIVIGSFICSGIPMGILNSFTVIYVELIRISEQEKIENAAYKTSLVGSLAFGLVLLLCIVSGMLCDRLGVRWTTILGTVIGSLGLLASSWLTNGKRALVPDCICPKVEVLLFTYSVVFGIGTALVLIPTLVILSFHFDKRFGLVNGIACTGGPIFGIILPAVIDALLPLIGLSGVFRVLALIFFVPLLLGAATFQVPAELMKTLKEKRKEKTTISTVINMEIWRNGRYVIWCISVAITSFGYFIPFIHIVKYVEVKFPGTNGSQFIIYLSLGAVCSRAVYGIVADFSKVNNTVLQLVSFIIMGILTMLLSACESWGAVIAVVVGLGILEGSFATLNGKIINQLCGVHGMAQAFGFSCGISSIPAIAGPAVAGYLFEVTGSYYIAFLICGSTPIIGGLLMSTMFLVKPTQSMETRSSSETSVATTVSAI